MATVEGRVTRITVTSYHRTHVSVVGRPFVSLGPVGRHALRSWPMERSDLSRDALQIGIILVSCLSVKHADVALIGVCATLDYRA
jgi:hypothetical protein